MWCYRFKISTSIFAQLTHQEQNVSLGKDLVLGNIFSTHFLDSISFENVVTNEIGAKSLDDATEDLSNFSCTHDSDILKVDLCEALVDRRNFVHRSFATYLSVNVHAHQTSIQRKVGHSEKQIFNFKLVRSTANPTLWQERYPNRLDSYFEVRTEHDCWP